MGASLVSVIATSSGAAAAYVKEGFANVRVGMFLEIATTLGAVAGAHLTAIVPESGLAIIFGAVLLYSAWHSLTAPPDLLAVPTDPLASRLRLNGSYPGPEGTIRYHVERVKAGFSLMFGAGVLSGLLGIGSGAMKVIAMDQLMRIPFKVSTTTSNFMIGVTAAASAGIYLSRGYIEPGSGDACDAGRTGRIAGRRSPTGRSAHPGSAAGIRRCDRVTGGRDDLQRHQRRLEMTDLRIDQIIGNLLRAGVASAAAVVAAGGIWYLVESGGKRPAYHSFHPDVRGLHSLGSLPHPQALILIGLMILIATPVARVAFSIAAFAIERDRAYVLITLIVLAVLLYSLGTSWL